MYRTTFATTALYDFINSIKNKYLGNYSKVRETYRRVTPQSAEYFKSTSNVNKRCIKGTFGSVPAGVSIMTTDDFDKRFEGMDSTQYKDVPVSSFEDTSTAFMQYMSAQGAKSLDPNSTEYLRAQMKYLQEMQNNQHPLDVLRGITLNPWSNPRDRIAAAKAMLEYTMMKVPAKFEVQSSTSQVKLDPAQLSKLSDEELNTLMTLLEKTGS